jgi:pyridinium-3,5-biscarboxylic acid mononucleotide synthase
MAEWLKFDWQRADRTGVPEAVLAAGKSAEQLAHIADLAMQHETPMLFTRLDADAALTLASRVGQQWDYDAESRTAFIGRHPKRSRDVERIVIVAAGSADMPVAGEVRRVLEFHGLADVMLIADVGVAGLWRLLERVDDLQTRDVVVAVAGMEGALFSVIGGLAAGLVIAVPTSVGYGVSAGGRAALTSALASCAPGIVTVNIDNGYGAACAALKALRRPGDAA